MNAIHQRFSVTTNTWTYRLGTLAQIDHVHVHYTSTATVGNRQIAYAILDGSGNIISDYHAGVNVPASTVAHIEFIPGHDRETQLSGPDSDHMVIGIPLLLIPGNYSIKVYDTADIAAADTMEINIFARSGF